MPTLSGTLGTGPLHWKPARLLAGIQRNFRGPNYTKSSLAWLETGALAGTASVAAPEPVETTYGGGGGGGGGHAGSGRNSNSELVSMRVQ